MKKLLLLVMAFCLSIPSILAQNVPGWLDKATKAVFSIITYDKDDNILNNGNGFFISNDGVALSDYSTFKGAKRAVAVGIDGKQMPISLIMGANELYDVVKFRVEVPKSVSALSLASTPVANDGEVYLIPYSTQKSKTCTSGKVSSSSKIESKYNYYTLAMSIGDKMVSCPIANSNGEVIAIAQKSVGNSSTNTGYGLDAAFGSSLSISVVSFNDANLRAIGIKKDLPEKEDQALVYMYMASSLYSNEDYTTMLNDFVAKFPDSSDGYLRRATNYVANDKDGSVIALADKDLETAIKIAKNKDDALYNRAKLIFDYLQFEHQNPYKPWTLDRALTDIREAIATNPLPLYVQLEGNILFGQKNYTEALTSYQKVNQSNISSPASYYNTAMTLQMLKHDSKEVLAMMDSCITHCPSPMTRESAPYLLTRAQLYMDNKMFRPALADYTNYYETMNGNVNDVFYYYREQAALGAHQYQLALDDIQAAVDSKPNDMVYLVEQAALNLRVGRSDVAVKQLQNAITVDPKYPEAYRILGLCYIEQKKNQDACTNFNKAKELGDPNAQAMIDKYCK